MHKHKVLITGGAGYIGSSLTTELLKLGYEVTVIDSLKYDKSSLNHLYYQKNFKLVKGDINNLKLLKKHLKNKDFIIPLAALVGAPLCDKFKKEAIQTNVNSIKNICKFSKKYQKIIFLTTNSGYGVGEKNKFCDENSPLRPVSLYGKTKNDAEKIISKRRNFVTFRLATVFGYSYRMRTDLLVNFMVYWSLNNRKIKVYEKNFRRNFIHISDVIKGIIFALVNFNKIKNNIYNLGLSNANITKGQLVNKIKKYVTKLKVEFVKNKKDPDQRDYFVSNKKIEKKGFKATYNLDDGIMELINIFKNNNKKYKNNY